MWAISVAIGVLLIINGDHSLNRVNLDGRNSSSIEIEIGVIGNWKADIKFYNYLLSRSISDEYRGAVRSGDCYVSELSRVRIPMQEITDAVRNGGLNYMVRISGKYGYVYRISRAKRFRNSIRGIFREKENN